MNLRKEGFKNKTKLITKPASRKISAERALAIYVDAKLTKRSYELIREPCKDVYPCYKIISTAKNRCYPPDEAIRVSETKCEVKLQALLDHTCNRIFTNINHTTIREAAKSKLLFTTCTF